MPAVTPSPRMLEHGKAVIDAYRRHPRWTRERWDNLCQAVDDYLAGRPRTTAVPYALFIEASSRCNLSCPLCPTGAGVLGRPATSLDFDLYTALIDELADRIFEVHFAFFGEPLFHRRLEEMVAYADGADVDTRLMTNGTLITADRAARLVGAGLRRVTISADAFDEVTYRSYRRGGHMRHMVKGIENLLRARADAGTAEPLVEIQFLAMRANEDRLDEMVDRAWSLGADRVKVKRLSLDLVDVSDDVRTAFLPTAPDLRYYDLETGAPTAVVDDEDVCPSLYLQPGVVMADGRTALCCRDPSGLFSYGEPAAGGFTAIWQGSLLNEIRASFRDVDARPALCASCAVLHQHGFQARVIDRQSGRGPTQ